MDAGKPVLNEKQKYDSDTFHYDSLFAVIPFAECQDCANKGK